MAQTGGTREPEGELPGHFVMTETDEDFVQLRERAEPKVRELKPEEIGLGWPAEARQMLHELRIHQIELEMQNEELRATRERLEVSHARYFDLYDLAPVGYITLSEEGVILEANLTAVVLLGVDRSALPGRRLSHFILNDDQDNYYHLRNRLKSGQPQTCELRFKKKNGAPFWARLDVTAAPHDSGQLVWRVVIVDITERKRAENAVQKAFQQLRVITDNVPAAVTQCSRDLKYVWVSHNLAAWLGRKGPEEISGRPIVDVVGLEYFDTIKPYMERALAGELVEYETHVPYPAGGRWIHAVYVPTKGRDDEVDGWIAVITDVTGRHEAEERLRESEERFRATFYQAAVGITQTTLDGDWLLMNDRLCEILGYSRDELRGRTFIDITHPDDREACRSALRQLVAGEISTWSKEKRYIRKDGSTIWGRLFTSLVRDGHTQPQYFISVVEDITDLRRAQKEDIARRKLESLGTLAGGIAHDFNNLLGGVLVGADLALEEYRARLSPEEELKRIRNAAIRGSEIVRQMMIYAGKEREAVGLVDVSRIAGEMLQLLGVSVSKHAKLETHLSEDLPAVRASAGQIRQIVMNLVTNASEALGERDGTIRLTTSRAEGDSVRLEVADTGPGMPAETQARIFDPFFTTKPAGHGLGLAVVQGIVRDLGGAIHLASEPGKGAAFQILFPCAKLVAMEDGPTPRADELAEPLLGATILLVEDEEVLRRPLSKILRKNGFEILEAVNGSAAIDLLRASHSKIDAMLLDMTIPGLSSREVVAVAAEARPELKVVLTSAHDEQMVRTTVAAPQKCGFIRKPFQVAELVRTLRNVLS